MFRLFSFLLFSDMIKNTFITFVWACVSYVRDWFFDPSAVYLIKRVTPILGPSYLQKYLYTANKQKYCVVLNTTLTSFKEFKKTLHNIPKLSIPNRAIKSESIDVEKFNMYNGPLCDFYAAFKGVHVPYSIDFFRSSHIYHSPPLHIVYDMLGNENTFGSMKPIRSNVWLPDCSEHLKKWTRYVTTVKNEKSD